VIGAHDNGLRIHHEYRPGGVGQSRGDFIFFGGDWRRSQRLLLGWRYVSQFRKGCARILEQLQHDIMMSLPLHFGSMHDKLRFGPAGHLQLQAGYAGAYLIAQKLFRRRFAFLIPQRAIGRAQGVRQFKDTASRLVHPANPAILLKEHCRPGSLFENKIRFASHRQRVP
jgi:hypothetical protein